MPALTLPVFGTPTVHPAPAEQLAAFLAPPNAPGMVVRMGPERVVRHEGELMVLQGQRFRTRTGWVQAFRYLILARTTGQPVGAAQITVRREGGVTLQVLSNIVVELDHRRQGIASRLVHAAQQDFSRLKMDATLTPDGARLFGLGEPQTLPEAPLSRRRLSH